MGTPFSIVAKASLQLKCVAGWIAVAGTLYAVGAGSRAKERKQCNRRYAEQRLECVRHRWEFDKKTMLRRNQTITTAGASPTEILPGFIIVFARKPLDKKNG